MNEIKRIAIDTSKSVFTFNLRRQELLGLFARLPPTEVVLEACGGSHHWGRTLRALGHRVRLIPPQYVKPFVKRSKNDRNDAEAISEAASRPGMREVPVKSAARQAEAMLSSVQELLTRQRTQLVNALRGHAAEFGLVAPLGLRGHAAEFGLVAPLGRKGLAQLRAEIANGSLPGAAVAALDRLGREIDRLEARLAEVDATLMQQHKATPTSRRLAGIPGVGPTIALNYALRVDPRQFKSGRHFAAWLGLVPRERSTGGKQRLGGISRAGNER
ncbi:MAG: IS110 family transposase, partial [Alphaproteobacteria bacterium]|nr:IS110 family transposase [Alphaproteobacteria bacterium]